jgi:uncharacterized protein
MCSTFVLAQTASLDGSSRWTQLLLPYHIGRLVTYASLGAVVGFGFHFLNGSPVFVVLRHLLLAAVAVIFLSVFAERALARFGVSLPRPAWKPACAIGAMNRVREVKTPLARFGLGAALGFLPCPMIFAALMAVAAHADPAMGALGMAAFAAGTTPILMGLGVGGARLFKFSPRARQALGLAAFGVNGVVLLALAFG